MAEPVARMTPATFRRILDANLIGAYNAVHHSLPLLAADAPLVFIGAVSERMRLPGLSAYAAAKAGPGGVRRGAAQGGTQTAGDRGAAGRGQHRFWQKVPFKMPGNALSPEAVAEKVVEAIGGGHQGALDL